MEKEIEREIKKEVKMESEAIKEANWLLPASILVAAVLIAGAVIYSTGVKNQPAKQDTQAGAAAVQIADVKLDDNDVVLGNSNAPVTIVEFGDFQCPFCSKFFKETESLIQKNYIDTGKVKMVFKTLAILGNESTNAGLAAYCAKDQNKFWEFHDAIYNTEYDELQKYLAGQGPSSENNGNLTRTLFGKIASDLKMDTNAFLSCYDSKKYQKALDDNLQQAQSLMGSISTPTLFINGKEIQGAQPYGVFSGVIDSLLK